MRLVTCLVLMLAPWCAARADLTCAQPVITLGAVKAGAPLAQQFRFTNTGTDTVELIGLKSSCACFRPELPVRSLKPGESATVKLEGNTLAQTPGPQSWRVRLGYREKGAERELIFEVRATVVVELAVQPATLTLTTDGVLTHDLTVRDLRAKPLDVTAVQTTNPGLRAKFGAAKHVPEVGWVRSVTVEVGADYPVGRRDELLVLHSRDADYPELRVPITVVKRAKAALPISPSLLVYRLVPGEPLPARLVQIGAEATPVEIERVEPLHPAVSATFAAGTLQVRVAAAQVPAGGLESGVRVHLKGVAPGPVVVPVRVVAP